MLSQYVCDMQRLMLDATNYFDSPWANPKSLKSHFNGIGKLRLA